MTVINCGFKCHTKRMPKSNEFLCLTFRLNKNLNGVTRYAISDRPSGPSIGPWVISSGIRDSPSAFLCSFAWLVINLELIFGYHHKPAENPRIPIASFVETEEGAGINKERDIVSE